MKPAKAATAEDYTLKSEFEDLKERLSSTEYADRMSRPLSYWALPNDRRLPYALLGRKVEQLLSASFEELSSTPGIGRKKIASLMMLLRRVLAEKPVPPETSDGPGPQTLAMGRAGDFDASLVSESLWATWRETVRRHDLANEKLGHLAPSLSALPTVIWDTPLAAYLNLRLEEIRGLKTHGDKRVRVILEVFYAINQLLEEVTPQGQMAVRLSPRFVASLEQWICEEYHRHEVPELQDLRQHLLLPLLNQIELDGGETVHHLVAGRFGVEGPAESVRLQAHRLNVTRARIYQLLEVCAQIMSVRWPEGIWQLSILETKLSGLGDKDERVLLVKDIRALMFPTRITMAAEETVLVASQ
jgi:hypothetical protein